MANSNPLFTLPILPTPNSPPTGSITCTSPSLKVYLLTFTSPPDNRLVTSFCQTLLLALDILEFSYPHGVVITTSGIQKFYSNGLELEHATTVEGFWKNSFFKLSRRLLTYPMPTVALLNGHAFAGGFMLSMYHDYRIFNPSRGFVCLNELDLGIHLKPAMSSIFRQKLVPSVYTEMVLEARRFSGKEALEKGIVNELGGLDEALKFVESRKLVEKVKTGVLGLLKDEMWRETISYIDNLDGEDKKFEVLIDSEDERKSQGERRVKEWEKNAVKAKL